MVKLNSDISYTYSYSLSGGASSTCGVDVEFPRYGIHEVKGIERFGRAGPHTTEVTIISRVCELINFSYSGFRQKKKIHSPPSQQYAGCAHGQQALDTHQCTSPSRSRDAGSPDVSVWLLPAWNTSRLGRPAQRW